VLLYKGQSRPGSRKTVATRHCVNCLTPSFIQNRHEATMKYLLDTDTFSDIVRGNANVEARFARTSLSLLGISSVTIKEIQYGRSLCPERVTRRGIVIDSLLRKIEALPFDVEVAQVTGQLRASLSRAGTPIGPYDVMIAGTALVHGLVLITANTREFARVSGLRLENWRLPPSEVRERPGGYQVKVKSWRGVPKAA
jgi:tRNA(fMet)-specific endonuclease VapC